MNTASLDMDDSVLTAAPETTDEKMILPKQHGEYQELVAADQEDEEDPFCDEHDSDEQENQYSILKLLNKNWISDDSDNWTFRDVLILQREAVKFLKFLFLSLLEITVIHYVVKWLDWEHDPKFSLSDLLLYDYNLVVLDVMVFFVVGRLFSKTGVDTLAWLIPTMVSAFSTSWSTNFKFMQYSFSLYEVHCHWPWQLFLFCAVLIPLVVFVVWIHLREFAKRKLLVTRLAELSLTILFFIVPSASNANFHLHHWYLGWMLGMHTNLNTWWSRLTMAWLWGWYINGIAVYGRDPILACADAFYRSTDQHCPFMACYLELDDDDDNLNNSTEAPHYKPMVKPNWRNCTGYIP